MPLIRTAAGAALLGALVLAAPAQADPRSQLEADAIGPIEISAGAGFVSADVPASRVRLSSGADAREIAGAMLSRYADVLGVDPAALEYRETETDEIGHRHVTYGQRVGGLPVLNAEVAVHLDDDGLRGFTSGAAPARALADAGAARIDAARAESAARAQVTDARVQSEPRLVAYAGALADRREARAAWVVDVIAADLSAHKEVVVDAADGRVLELIELAPDSSGHHGTRVGGGPPAAAERERALGRPADDALPPPPPPPPPPLCNTSILVATHDAHQGTQLGASVLRQKYVMNPDTDKCEKKTLGATPDGGVKSTHGNAIYARDHFWGKHKFSGWNGSSATTVAAANWGTVHGAWWIGNAMVFHTGWGVRDVVGHEYGHAVDDHTAKLVYKFQSGALDESFADASGWDMDPADPKIGEDAPSGALRDMDWPHLHGQPETVSGYLCASESNDAGGVHTNSGIPNWAYAWMVWYMGRTDAQKIRWYAHKNLLGPNSGFAAARTAYIQAANILGLNATATRDSWDWTGVTASWSPAC